jgi:hypothetical protein
MITGLQQLLAPPNKLYGMVGYALLASEPTLIEMDPDMGLVFSVFYPAR